MFPIILLRPRLPHLPPEERPDDLDLVASGQEPGEQVGATGGVVGEIEGEDRDLQA